MNEDGDVLEHYGLNCDLRLVQVGGGVGLVCFGFESLVLCLRVEAWGFGFIAGLEAHTLLTLFYP